MYVKEVLQQCIPLYAVMCYNVSIKDGYSFQKQRTKYHKHTCASKCIKHFQMHFQSE